MTTVYFVRHAQRDTSNHEELPAPLTEKGLRDRELVTAYLSDKGVQAAYSSPAKRAVDTIAPFAQQAGLTITPVDDLRERRADSVWVEDFWGFAQRQWADFDYKLSDGESLHEVQRRNVAAVWDILRRHPDQTLVIGTHGTALSTLIHYYDPSCGYDDFRAMADVMPWVVKMLFVGIDCAGMQKIDLFVPPQWKPPVCNNVSLHRLGELCAYRFVVIFVRVGSRWLYCRHRERDCWETPGGHVEQGETPLQAAARELWEETGIRCDSLRAICDYRVHLGNEYSNGQLFLAELGKPDRLPTPPADFEMAEVRCFDTIPDRMRFPHILPALFRELNDRYL